MQKCLKKPRDSPLEIRTKLYLTCLALSLMCLASADPSAQPISTMLYSAEHVIGNGFDLRYLDYRLNPDDSGNHKLLSFNAAGDAPELVNAYMMLHKNHTDLETSGIAVVTYRPVVGQRPDSKLCLERSSTYLRNLIQSCYGNVALRGLTEAEKQQLQKFKDESKGTPNFKLVYERKRIRTQLFGIDYFNLKDFKEFRYRSQNNLNVVTNPLASDITSMRLNDVLDEKSFVIESTPASLNLNCFQTDLTDLKPSDCFGKVRLRKVTRDD